MFSGELTSQYHIHITLFQNGSVKYSCIFFITFNEWTFLSICLLHYKTCMDYILVIFITPHYYPLTFGSFLPSFYSVFGQLSYFFLLVIVSVLWPTSFKQNPLYRHKCKAVNWIMTNSPMVIALKMMTFFPSAFNHL